MAFEMELNFFKLKKYLYEILYILNNFLNPFEFKRNLSNFINIFFFFKKDIFKKHFAKEIKKSIVYCYPSFTSTLVVSFFVISLRIRGYKVIGILHSYNFFLKKIYSFFGVSDFLYLFSAYKKKKKRHIVLEIEKNSLKNFFYKKVPVGKIVLSTLMRKYKSSKLSDFKKTEIFDQINLSINIIDLVEEKLKQIKPKILITQDRGYFPEAEIFEIALLLKIKCIEIHMSHRSEFLVFKKYSIKNKSQHFNSLSKKTMNFIKNKKISYEEKKEFFSELEYCYNSGRWYEEVGTQYQKEKITKKDFFKRFKLDPKRKVAVLFSHIFWDGTFFFGKDLFADYEDWFKESLKVMIKNDKVNWIIKAHPANIVKDSRDNKKNKSELQAINEITKNLPNHIKFVDAHDPISTLSFLKIIDYCITVRGTVGIESACFGVPVLTAGTGRYDGVGFTIDHKTQHSYLNSLRNIQKIKKYKKTQVNLALKFAHTLFCRRVFSTSNIKFFFERNENFSMNFKIEGIEVYNSKNIKTLSKWLENNDEDYINSHLI